MFDIQCEDLIYLYSHYEADYPMPFLAFDRDFTASEEDGNE